jgi:predicted nucleic acid-binding protein
MGIRGPRIFDLQIGMIALENGARELWTHDAGFVAVPGLKVRDPLLE